MLTKCYLIVEKYREWNSSAKMVEMDESLMPSAARLKAKFELSVADCWIIATAIEKKAIIVHKDPEFERVDDMVTSLKLPYKR